MIDLQDAKRHLRVDYDDEDDDITLKLKFASAIIYDYIGATDYQNPVREDFASDAEYEKAAAKADLQNGVVDAATLLVLGELFANREAGSDPLSATVKIILERLRVPSFA